MLCKSKKVEKHWSNVKLKFSIVCLKGILVLPIVIEVDLLCRCFVCLFFVVMSMSSVLLSLNLSMLAVVQT